jgi:hypothetical protein
VEKDKFDYFIDQTNQRLISIESKVDQTKDTLENKFDQLNNFRLMIVGGTFVISTIVSFLVMIYFR